MSHVRDQTYGGAAGVKIDLRAGTLTQWLNVLGMPGMTAWWGLMQIGKPKAGETVLVMGVNGKVGQAAVQIASWRGARVIGVVRRSEPYEGHSNAPVEVIDASAIDVAAQVR